MRVRADWLTCLFVCLGLTACSSDKPASEAAESSASGSSDDSDAGKSSAGKSGSKSSSQNTGGSGSAGRKASNDEEDAGQSSGGSGGAKNHDAGAADSGKTSLPTDGNQLALCARAEGDCNKGFACHAPASAFSPGRGFCSKLCEEDADCAGLTPSSAQYTCGNGPGTKSCELACSGADDTSCPSGMKCLQTAAAQGGGRRPAAGGSGADAGAGGSGGRAAQFHCRYPFETSGAWGVCGDATHACEEDLTCSGGGSGRTAHCVQSCEMDSDCAKPSSGSVTPSCATIVPARGMNSAVKQCVLDCSAAKDGCPTGLECVDGPRRGMGMGMNAMPEYSRCE